MNRMLVKQVCTMLIDAKLPDGYWWDALQYAVLLYNMSPMCSLSDYTPKESWSGNKPDVSCLCVFSCKAFVHIPDKMHGKLLCYDPEPSPQFSTIYFVLSVTRSSLVLSRAARTVTKSPDKSPDGPHD